MSKNNIIYTILFVLMTINPFISCYAGIVVVGTAFNFNDNTKSINIKVINDEYSDYLINVKINKNHFIVSPPLFVLQKNSSNILTIIPRKITTSYNDNYDLTITAIPKSEENSTQSIYLALRYHLKVIYDHN